MKKVKSPIKNGVAKKVPVVIQLEALECGAACLTMILAYYGKWIPLEQVRSDCGVSRDGSKAGKILKAARNYGFEAKGFKYDVEDLKKEATFPCIIFWNNNHFVVLDGFKGNYAVINDPARGKTKYTIESFEKNYSGICLTFNPTTEFKPEGKPKSVIKFAKKRLKGTKAMVLFTFVTTIIASLLSILQPGFSRIFIDRLLTHQNPEWFVPFIVGIAVITFIKIIIQLINQLYSLKLNGKLAVVGNTTYMWKVLKLPMEFFSQRMAGDIIGRQSQNASVASTFINIFTPLILQAGMAIFYLVGMFRYNVMLSLIGLSSLLVDVIVTRIITKKRVDLSRVGSRDGAMLASTTASGIQMIETIKASGAENGFFRKWAGYQANVNNNGIQMNKMTMFWGLIPSSISMIVNVTITTIGLWLTMNGEFTVGMIMAFQGYLSSFMGPVDQIVSAGNSLLEMRTSMERIEDVMEYPDDDILKESNQDTQYRKLSGEVELKNVSFGYSKLEAPLIEDFSLKLKPGSRVALVGPSGCGKSTISKLVSGLYKQWSGEILFDGKPISEIDKNIFRGSLAVVDQDITLFEDTITNNIKMWDDSIEGYEVIMAARDAGMHEEIQARDGGYNYKLIENGKDFSGGQRQRLEIARVLAQDPTIVILDEATSALDAKTEYEVTNAIKDRGVTCIIVAHRLSTIRDCDEIIVLDNGKVVERGTHDELYAKNGAYTALVSND